MSPENVSLKISPIYVQIITDFENLHSSLSTSIISNYFTITPTKNVLKVNVSSIDDYRNISKKPDESELAYHTYLLPSVKQLSLIIRNLPISISKKSIFNVLTELSFDKTSVIRLQNRYTCPIPIVAVLLS